MTLRVIDLFSGIGGFTLAADWLGGFTTVQFVEREPYCQKILRKHWPDVPIHDDVCTYTPPSDQLMLSSEVFPVKTSQLQENKRVSKKALGLDCSTNSCESFAQWDRDTSSWKTSQQSLLTGLEPFSERWPRQGMTVSGRAYRRQLWAPAISVIGGGALPTLRSPTTHDYRRRGTNSNQRGLSNIEDWATLPMPVARDWKGRSTRNGALPNSFVQTGGGMSLNPSFVEEMMGFPVGWTA